MISKITNQLFNIQILLLLFLFINSKSLISQTKKWVGTWATAPQLVEPNNMPPSPGLTNNSLRQVVRVSIGGDTIRLKFSNEFSNEAVTMKSVQIAVSTGGSSIDISTNKELTFNGKPEITMNPGTAVVSDPIAFNLKPRMDVAITIYYGQTSSTVTGHPGSRTTSYLLPGNDPSVKDFSNAIKTDHWYNINAIEVLVPSNYASVAILGNSITDGRGSTTNMQNRWTDIFSEKLLKDPRTQHIGVLNLGIGGNCVLSGGLGPTAISRFDRDILSQSSVRWIIVFIGVNDIGKVTTEESAKTTANNLIDAYKQMIAKAHAKNIRIYGATITPFKGNQYYNQYSEMCRSVVNQWIRTKGNFDACIDFDKIMRDPADTLKLISSFQNDGLHPDADGYKKMGESIDLNLFTGEDTVFQQGKLEYFWFEAEKFVKSGSNFNVISDIAASNGKYITVKPGVQSLNSPPSKEDLIEIPVSILYDTTYNIFGRINCPSYNDDSFWITVDNELFYNANGLKTNGWEWFKLNSYSLKKGNHILKIGYREDGACLDKICITNDLFAPVGMGGIDSTLSTVKLETLPKGFLLEQNFPNPFNPNTNISFTIPVDTFVSLKIYDTLGKEITSLVSEKLLAGKYSKQWNAEGLSSGVYFYRINAGNFTQTKKLVLLR
ncbi:GDSL-type esterase/lipase family protein [Rosettibacter firmus]|uniref:GDSL-type esterase/lipase family protein n=1 Tax=Rosettibacter firmus TaxID=3111522 RepID=UPI00336C13C5